MSAWWGVHRISVQSHHTGKLCHLTEGWLDTLKYNVSLILGPLTKTCPCGEEIRWTDSWCSCSTEWAFQNHWMVNLHVPPSKHLFTFKTATGDYAPMCRSWFLSRCNEVWSSKGLSTLLGLLLLVSPWLCKLSCYLLWPCLSNICWTLYNIDGESVCQQLFSQNILGCY